jgi:hypothetical protein
MEALPANRRLWMAGVACSGLVLAAGIIATTNAFGIAIASGLLTVAAIVGIIAIGIARAPGAAASYAVLIAAALPLFFAFYAAGFTVLRYLGQKAAGGLLMVIAILLAIATHVATSTRRGHAPH